MKVNISEMTFEDIVSIEQNFSNDFDKFWSINILKEDFNSNYSKYIVAKIDTEIVGFAGIKVVLDEADIMNIVTKVTKRKQGIGSLLLEALINLAIHLKCKSINLEVNENNMPAIHLYEKYKFKRIGLRKKYYNNTDNAILMKMAIWGRVQSRKKTEADRVQSRKKTRLDPTPLGQGGTNEKQK